MTITLSPPANAVAVQGCEMPSLGMVVSVRHAEVYADPAGYTDGMTKKIGISLPDDLYDWMQSQVAAGEADSISGLITRIVATHRQRMELAALIADLEAEFGEATPEEMAWVDRAMALATAVANGEPLPNDEAA
ncbi:hypothetical protein Mth01_29380 [Sphaerimonospora thailandensis]|uniref:Uncharacterized protein n=2 Tax=Sphaerimonospora thailandensis TaxID=795644 RepID=A0A8J3W015_9ACTN|nr:hypothetical protein Mth01_29380 [Sphaerimonospora thailandensis]